MKKEFKDNNLGIYSKNDKHIFEKVTSNNRLNIALKNCSNMYEQFKCISSASNKNPCTTIFMLVQDLSEYL